jgi:hypothetical protein
MPIAARRAAASACRGLIDVSLLESRASTTARSCGVNASVSWATIVATQALIRPRATNANVSGSWRTSVRASASRRAPVTGDTRHARASCSATPTPKRRAGTPTRFCSATCESANRAISAACTANAAACNRSSAAIRSTRTASSTYGSTGADASRPSASTISSSWATDPSTMGVPQALPETSRSSNLIRITRN